MGSTVLLFVAFTVSEETLAVSRFFKEDRSAGLGILLGGSFMAFAYNIVVIAVLLWDKEISPMSIVGFGIFFCGLFAYSYLTFKSRNSGKPATPEPPKKEADKEDKEDKHAALQRQVRNAV